jgi:hypothetical protein
MNPSAKQGQLILSRVDLAGASIAGALSLILYGWLMVLWRDHGILAQYNIIFDTDPNIRLATLAHGWGSDGMVHPLLRFMFSIPIRMGFDETLRGR